MFKSQFYYLIQDHVYTYFNSIFQYHRLKKIQDKKRIARAKAEKEKELRKAQGKLDDEAANILDDERDEDVLF